MTHATMIENLAPSGHDPRHIEAIMRLRNPTLDGLSPGEFRKEVSVAVACIVKLGTIKAEEIAQSLGLARRQVGFGTHLEACARRRPSND